MLSSLRLALTFCCHSIPFTQFDSYPYRCPHPHYHPLALPSSLFSSHTFSFVIIVALVRSWDALLLRRSRRLAAMPRGACLGRLSAPSTPREAPPSTHPTQGTPVYITSRAVGWLTTSRRLVIKLVILTGIPVSVVGWLWCGVRTEVCRYVGSARNEVTGP